MLFYHHQGVLLLFLRLSEIELKIPSRAGRCLHLVCGIKGGEIHLKLVVIFSIENHRLKPVTPENFSREIRWSRLKRHAAGLDSPLHDHNELKLLLGQVGGVEVEEGRVLVDDVDNLQRPHKEDVGLFIGVRGHLEYFLELDTFYCIFAINYILALTEVHGDTILDLRTNGAWESTGEKAWKRASKWA